MVRRGRRKPKGWKGEPRRHAEAARKGHSDVDRKPLPILAMVKASAMRDYEEMTPYGKHLALAYTAGFTPLSREEFEARRNPAMAARVR